MINLNFSYFFMEFSQKIHQNILQKTGIWTYNGQKLPKIQKKSR